MRVSRAIKKTHGVIASGLRTEIDLAVNLVKIRLIGHDMFTDSLILEG